MGKLAQCQSALQAALKLDPGNAKANHGMGVVLQLRGQLEDAAAHYEAAIAAEPEQRDSYVNCALAYERLKIYDRALMHYR